VSAGLEQNIKIQIEQHMKQPSIEGLQATINALIAKIELIEKSARELEQGELKQVEQLLVTLLTNMNLGPVLQEMKVTINGTSYGLQQLLEMLAAGDKVLAIQMIYSGKEIAGAKFILTNGMEVLFKCTRSGAEGALIKYVFTTDNWRGLPASFVLALSRQSLALNMCKKTVQLESYGLVFQSNVVFELTPHWICVYPTPELPKPTPELPKPTPELPKPTPELPKPTPELPKPTPLPTKFTALAFVHETSSTEGSKLYRLDLNTGKTTLVGPTVPDLADIAPLNSNALVGVQMGATPQLVRIDPRNGRSIVVGKMAADICGLASYQGKVYAVGGTHLYAVDSDTGATHDVGAWGVNQQGSGSDIAISAEGKTYTVVQDAGGKHSLAEVDLQSGAAREIGPIGSFKIFGMDFADGILFGVTDTGELVRIDTATGAGTLVAVTEPRGKWTGMACLSPPRK
jgi:hypothetical protein